MIAPKDRISKLVNGIAAGNPFTGPEGMERANGRSFKARLGANESGFGPSPKVIEAMKSALHGNWMYADPDCFDLIQAIASHHNVSPENVLIGEGIDGLLGLAVAALSNPGDITVTSLGAYATFNFHVQAHQGRLHKVPFKDDREHLEGLAAAAEKTNARIVYVSNPDNPMGTWWHADDLAAFERALPECATLFLDEAYCETAPREAIPELDTANARVVRFRTFSKAYGMAGARIGYAIGHEAIIEAIGKIRNQYGINRIGQIAALAAIRDQDYLLEAVRNIEKSRERLYEIARANTLTPIPSATNFVAIDCGRDEQFAQRVLDELLKRGVFIRKPGAPPLNRCIRVTAGTPADIDVFEAALPQALKAAQ